jgi:alpha-L-fucosidase
MVHSKKHFISRILVNVLFLVLAPAASGQGFADTWESLNTRRIPQWFNEAKFGIFIHWGVYSVPAWAPFDEKIGIYGRYAEWYWWRKMNPSDPAGKLFREHHDRVYGPDFKYEDFAPLFRAEHFDPMQWAELFRRAGARYVVLTAKHHDGFTLWPSAESPDWNSMALGPNRDLVGDLTKAVRDAGLRMGLYYSLYEWFNPLYRDNLEKYVNQHMIPQMKDLVIRYEPDILWVDGEWDHPSKTWESTRFLKWLFNESPVKDQVVVNDRWGSETRGRITAGFHTTEYGIGRNQIAGIYHPWEECRGIGTSFGYNRMETPEHYTTSEDLIHLLIETVAYGGNLLLNVGPTADGRIPAIQQQRLFEIGNWLKINGEAIFGTRNWEGSSMNKSLKNTFFTKNEDALFVLTTEFPKNQLSIKGLNSAKGVSLLGYSGQVEFTISNDEMVIVPPKVPICYNHLEKAWVFKIEL